MKKLIPLLLVLPFLLAADAEKPEAVTIKTAFGWIPKEHRFTVDAKGNIEWPVASKDAATEAAHEAMKTKIVKFADLPMEYLHDSGERAAWKGEQEMRVARSRYRLTVKLWTEREVRDKAKAGKLKADVSGEVFAVEYHHDGPLAECIITLRDAVVD